MSELRLKRHISGYIDDFYVQGQTYNERQLSTIEAVKLFDELGYVVHPIKNSLIPSQQIEHLGFVVNSVKMTVTLTESKIHNLSVMIPDVLNSHSITDYKTNCTVSRQTCFNLSSKCIWAIVLQKY